MRWVWLGRTTLETCNLAIERQSGVRGAAHGRVSSETWKSFRTPRCRSIRWAAGVVARRAVHCFASGKAVPPSRGGRPSSLANRCLMLCAPTAILTPGETSCRFVQRTVVIVDIFRASRRIVRFLYPHHYLIVARCCSMSDSIRWLLFHV